MDYVCFGTGKRVVVMIPGVGDGLQTVKGLASALALQHRVYHKDCRVYVFSRINNLPEKYTIRQMASDTDAAMEALGIEQADVLGVSQGGMIVQWLAIDFPQRVRSLVIAVSSAHTKDITKKVIGDWIELAKAGEYKNLMIDVSEKQYTGDYLKKYRRLYPTLGIVGKPKSFARFITQASSCLEHDARSSLPMIKCPTLVLGGSCDMIVGPNAAGELADSIPNSELYIYEGLGHGAYEQAKDFHRRVLDYFLAH